MADERYDVAAVVLAGGASSRMGAPKPFMRLQGRWLIERVRERLAPQVAQIYVNRKDGDDRFAELGAPLVPDAAHWRGFGPLAGIAAALARARADGFDFLVTSPCDAPFLPLDLVSRLMAPIAEAHAPASVATSDSGVEPLFALWPCRWLEQVEQELAEGRASPRGLLARLGAAPVSFPKSGGVDPFANLNTPDQLAGAEAALARISAIAPRDQTRGGDE